MLISPAFVSHCFQLSVLIFRGLAPAFIFSDFDLFSCFCFRIRRKSHSMRRSSKQYPRRTMACHFSQNCENSVRASRHRDKIRQPIIFKYTLCLKKAGGAFCPQFLEAQRLLQNDGPPYFVSVPRGTMRFFILLQSWVRLCSPKVMLARCKNPPCFAN